MRASRRLSEQQPAFVREGAPVNRVSAHVPPSLLGSFVLLRRRVTNRLSARRMRQKRAEEREAIAQEVRCCAECIMKYEGAAVLLQLLTRATGRSACSV